MTSIVFEHSTNIVERQQFYNRLKKLTEFKERQIKRAEEEPKASDIILRVLGTCPQEILDGEKKNDTINPEKKFLRLLKMKLLNYDIYKQAQPYDCSLCQEKKSQCVCVGVWPEKAMERVEKQIEQETLL